MANSIYGATFPKVTLDTNINYPNAHFNIKRITVEEWNDILHHTHKASEILDDDGNMSSSTIARVTVEEYTEMKESIQTLIEQNTELMSRIAALENASSGSGENTGDANGGITIGDWDVETPGIQTSPNGE